MTAYQAYYFAPLRSALRGVSSKILVARWVKISIAGALLFPVGIYAAWLLYLSNVDSKTLTQAKIIVRTLQNEETELLKNLYKETRTSKIPREKLTNPTLEIDVFPVDAFGQASNRIPKDHAVFRLMGNRSLLQEPTKCRFVVFREPLPKPPPSEGIFMFREARAVCPCTNGKWSLVGPGSGPNYDFRTEGLGGGDGMYSELCQHSDPLVLLNSNTIHINFPDKPTFIEHRGELRRARDADTQYVEKGIFKIPD